MGAVTLVNLVARARSRADMPLVGFVTAAELIDWINEGGQQLHEKLVGAYSEQYVTGSASIAVIAGGLAPLPTDFFKLYSIEMDLAGRTKTLLPYNRQERNVYKNALTSSYNPPKYSLVAGSIQLLPAPAVGTLVAITYAPEFILQSGASSVTFPNGWEKWIVAYAAKQMLMKEESDVRSLDGLLAQWSAELEEMKDSRDAAAPKQTVDMDAVEFSDLWGP